MNFLGFGTIYFLILFSIKMNNIGNFPQKVFRQTSRKEVPHDIDCTINFRPSPGSNEDASIDNRPAFDDSRVPSEGCECIPYYLCNNNRTMDVGVGFLSGVGLVSSPPYKPCPCTQATSTPKPNSSGVCVNYLDVCCIPPPQVLSDEYPGNFPSWNNNAPGNSPTWDNNSSGNFPPWINNSPENSSPWNNNSPGNSPPWSNNPPGNSPPWNSNSPGNSSPWSNNSPGNSPPWNNNLPGNSPPWSNNSPGSSPPWSSNPPGNSPPWNNNSPGNSPPWSSNPPGNSPPWNNNSPGNSPPWSSNPPGNSPPWNNNSPGNSPPWSSNPPGNSPPWNNNSPGNSPPWNNNSPENTPPWNNKQPGDPLKPNSPGNSPPWKNNFAECGQHNIDRLKLRNNVNKKEAIEYSDFPWMVAIFGDKIIKGVKRRGLFLCGGSLISPCLVLTAAHCVKGKSGLSIRMGEWNLQTTSESILMQERFVHHIKIHEEYYAGGLFNDISLLFLESPVEPASNIATVCLPEPTSRINLEDCLVSGWGTSVFGKDENYGAVLKRVELSIVPTEFCEERLRTTRLGKYFHLHEGFICAQGRGGEDTCTGDGGSPLVCSTQDDPNVYVQVGIVSWGIGCGGDIPGVYINVTYFRPWIDNEMATLRVDEQFG